MDVDTFTTRLDRLNKFICEKDEHVGQKKFLPYVQNKLVPLLKAHVIEPVKAGKCKPNWTNNNCESANHIPKSATEWKLKEFPKFINILYEIISGEKTERCRAIRDMGNFKLTQPFSHHILDIDAWTNLTQEQKEKKEFKFLTDKGRYNPNMIVSTDGTRTVVRQPSAGKKNRNR